MKVGWENFKGAGLTEGQLTVDEAACPKGRRPASNAGANRRRNLIRISQDLLDVEPDQAS